MKKTVFKASAVALVLALASCSNGPTESKEQTQTQTNVENTIETEEAKMEKMLESGDIGTGTSNTDTKAMVKEYEKFVDEYIVVYKKSIDLSKKAQEGDMTAAVDAANVAQEAMALQQSAQELGEKIENAKGDLDEDDLKRFAKMQGKLAAAAMEALK